MMHQQTVMINKFLTVIYDAGKFDTIDQLHQSVAMILRMIPKDIKLCHNEESISPDDFESAKLNGGIIMLL